MKLYLILIRQNVYCTNKFIKNNKANELLKKIFCIIVLNEQIKNLFFFFIIPHNFIKNNLNKISPICSWVEK